MWRQQVVDAHRGPALEAVVRRRHPELGLDVREARPRPHPELAVAGVAEELVTVARGQRAKIEHRRVAVGDRIEDEYRIRLAVGAHPGEVRERRVRAEDVVAVIAAHLQPPRRDDETFARELRAHGGAAGRRLPGRLGQRGERARTWRPVPLDKCAKLVGGRPGPVFGVLLLFTHRTMVPPAQVICLALEQLCCECAHSDRPVVAVADLCAGRGVGAACDGRW